MEQATRSGKKARNSNPPPPFFITCFPTRPENDSLRLPARQHPLSSTFFFFFLLLVPGASYLATVAEPNELCLVEDCHVLLVVLELAVRDHEVALGLGNGDQQRVLQLA